jgi:hypothetical protein
MSKQPFKNFPPTSTSCLTSKINLLTSPKNFSIYMKIDEIQTSFHGLACPKRLA